MPGSAVAWRWFVRGKKPLRSKKSSHVQGAWDGMGGCATAFTAPATPPFTLPGLFLPSGDFSRHREPLTVFGQEQDSLRAPLPCRHNPNETSSCMASVNKPREGIKPQIPPRVLGSVLPTVTSPGTEVVGWVAVKAHLLFQLCQGRG